MLVRVIRVKVFRVVRVFRGPVKNIARIVNAVHALSLLIVR